MSLQRVRAAQAGVSGVHVTPFDSSGQIAGAMLETVIDRLSTAGVDNIVAAGNTGEFYALTMEEIRDVYRIVIATADGRSIVTASVGRSLYEAQSLAEQAELLGADALMIHQVNDPFVSPKGIAAYVHAIANVGTLPVILYVRNDCFEANELIDMVGHPRVVAIKYAVPDPLRLADRIRRTTNLDLIWVCGLAEAWAVPFASLGARGFTSGLVNVNPDLSVSVRDALLRQDYVKARGLIDKVASFEALRARRDNGDNVTVVKHAMRLLGFDVGQVRPPGTPELSASEGSELAEILRSWGLSVQQAA